MKQAPRFVRRGHAPSIVLLVLAGMASDAHSADNFQPLFAGHEPLHLVIETPLSELIRNKMRDPVVPATIIYRDETDREIRLKTKLSPRGQSRLEYCRFPPLRLTFRNRHIRDSLFAEQKRLKLVTHCRSGTRHATWVRQEYLIYRMFNRITDESFRVRWVTIDYRDPERPRNSVSTIGFFIERTRNLAKRLETKRVRRRELDIAKLDANKANLVALFQLMIGNTDWSMLSGGEDRDCCHNGKVLDRKRSDEPWMVVPYDFDQSGLINTDYAVPSPAVRISSVRTRRYRGFCLHNDQVPGNVERLQSLRAEIFSVIQDDLLPPRVQARMNDYLQAFYAIMDDPDKIRTQISGRCRGPAT